MALYALLMHLVRALALPWLWWLGRRVPAFREHWNERLARVDTPERVRGGIVVHAVSMGEVSAALPLVEALLAQRPDLPLTFTCTTPTASALIRDRLGARVHHVYLPFDTPGAVRRFLAGLQPRLLVLLETELWPALVRQAHADGALVVLANARLSERSARRYARLDRWTRGLLRQMLTRLDLVLAQDAAVAARFVDLGMAPGRVRVTGSLKTDSPLPLDTGGLQQRFRTWVAGRRVCLAASTHEGEEAAVLQAWPVVRAAHPDALLVLVPRHPQRFGAVAALVAAAGLRLQRSSEGQACAPATDVLLGDAMGQLRAWMGVAESAFIGGSLVPVGGHNPLEAMAFGTPVLCGPHTFNFEGAFAALQAQQALACVHDAPSLAEAWCAWLGDPQAAQAAGRRGLALFATLGGATQRSLAPLLGLLDRQAGLAQAELDDGEAWVDPEVLAQARAHWFEAEAWRSRGEVLGQASGRATAWFLRHGVRELVLRHYYRGGLMGRLVRDRFLAQPTADTRAMAEHALLRRLRAWGLPVPRPVAARVQRHGLQYRSDILVERISGAQDLAHWLVREPLPEAQWRAVGRAIGRLHAHGVWHSDLNCHNLLTGPGEAVWIIDFDKCGLRPPGPWMQANLERLLRSLRKERGRQVHWHWGEHDWLALTAGWQQGWDEAAAAAAAPSSPSSSPASSSME